MNNPSTLARFIKLSIYLFIFIYLFKKYYRYQILHSCLTELMDKQIIQPEVILLSDPRELLEETNAIEESKEAGVQIEYPIQVNEEEMNIPAVFQISNEGTQDNQSISYEGKLWKIALMCENMSGRTLRKIPLRAHAMYLQKTSSVTLDEYLKALNVAVKNVK